MYQLIEKIFDGVRWVNSRKKFFIPVNVLSKKFKKKFLYYLKQYYAAGLIGFHGKISALANEDTLKALQESTSCPGISGPVYPPGGYLKQ